MVRGVYLSRLGLLVALSMALITGCASTLRVENQPTLPEMAVDGNRHEDWVSGLTLAEKENLWLGFRNDGDYLYVLLTTVNRDVLLPIATGGLTVWFDPDGGKKKVFGVRYPVGVEGGMQAFTPGAARPDPAAVSRHLEESGRQFEVLRRGAPPVRLASQDTLGIQVAVSFQNGTMVCEMKVPLRSSPSEPFAVGAAPGSPLGVGFETPEFERPTFDSGGRGGMPGGAPPEGAPPGGGPPGGMPAGGQPSQPERLDLWTLVTLASPQTGTAPRPDDGAM